ncbi:DUF2975 domain-containing protein [Winogradskyella alexanderae]|uniref:DUF2975 domain-containing protein n=1 Tax=Winogradskyella alexanderae TaxID=2877123 RepID=A0ABS7XN55_9FLAO|nr:DUF2975 domain-containing protein [Winogradskyella alexanderae]MCA0131440.1 DUF2975 domain-containing protein [Winogradskyella alexanderae]
MRKLIILKSLVDFIWIVTCIPMIGLLVFFIVFMFIDPESLHLVFDMDEDFLKSSKIMTQIFGLLFVLLFLIGIYCIYLFRKTLRYFQKVKPFHDEVILNFHKIGYLLSAIGLVGAILIFVARLILKNEFKINLGLSPYILLICLGLFFMVLSEVFKVAKHAKEENDLTV